MKKKNLIVNFIIGVFVFFISPILIFSQTQDYTQKIKIINFTPLPTITKKINLPKQNDNNNQNNNQNNQKDENQQDNKKREKLVYYAQRDPKYASIKMDNAFCSSGNPATIGNAGCGPTTVAMIVASYVNKNINPVDIVRYYDENGWLACGTSVDAARKTLEHFGLKLTPDNSILSISQMKKMIDNGWTLMALATITYQGSSGINQMSHYFWIVDVDDKNNVLVYDPWWSYQKPLPTNNNQHIKVEYRQVFGIKVK